MKKRSQSFLSDKLACVVFKITKVAFSESIEVFRKDLLFSLFYSFFSLMIFPHHYLFPATELYMLTTWPFVTSLPQYLLLNRPHKEPQFDRIADLTPGVFLSIQTNVKYLFF